MCGRYALTTPPQVVAALFDLIHEPPYELRYNVAPTQEAPVVRAAADGEERRLDLLRWGPLPASERGQRSRSWAINGRSETAHARPAFRDAFARRRCIVPASGFFEWKATDAGKVPHYVYRADGEPLALAGLWELLPGRERDVECFTILTTAPNDTMQPLHDRMPAVLERDSFAAWLGPRAEGTARLRELLRPAAGDVLSHHPVSARVNRTENDDPACVAPARVIERGLFDGDSPDA